jgi:hypothetical protein
MTNLWGVQRDELASVWPTVEPILREGMDKSSRLTTADVLPSIKAGDQQLWVGWDNDGVALVAITEVYATTQDKAVSVLMVSGRGLDDCKTHLKAIENWGRSIGCCRIEMLGREGWCKVLPDYTKTRVLLEKDLTDG